MNILYIAYSCSPYHGSEDKIGWHIPVESAKKNRVFVLTKEEQKKYIEQYQSSNPLENITFYYVDIHKVWKKVFKGPFYSGRLNIWNKRALSVANEICEREKIDIIHQITPVEFRSIGDYGKIPNIKFVCGPIGGGEYIPSGLKKYAKKCVMIEWMRSLANDWYRYQYGLHGKLEKCAYLLYANEETASYLNPLVTMQREWPVQTEIGIERGDLREVCRETPSKKCKFLVVGRLIYRKGHMLLIDALGRIPRDFEWECHVVGNGPEMEHLKKTCLENKLNGKVFFDGTVPHGEMRKKYASADVLVMPSIRETTGSVILEAMTNGLPVVTINKFGGKGILDEKTGWLYDGQTKEAYVESLKTALVSCITQPNEVLRRGKNAREQAETYTWDARVQYYQTIYDNLVDFT